MIRSRIFLHPTARPDRGGECARIGERDDLVGRPVRQQHRTAQTPHAPEHVQRLDIGQKRRAETDAVHDVAPLAPPARPFGFRQGPRPTARLRDRGNRRDRGHRVRRRVRGEEQRDGPAER
jgi:hypothetical protein